MKVLVTGGAGYIGSHTMVELLTAGYEVVCVDDLSNSSIKAVQRVEQITDKKVCFVQQDLCDKDATLKIFQQHKVDAVIHFAGFKAVGESVKKPIMYYRNNIDSTLSVVDAMVQTGVKNIVFSSSATVYGDAGVITFKEGMPVGGTTNPYGTSKYFIERILQDTQVAHPDLNVALLRYFNPIGAHKSGLIGEDPNGIPNNLLPYIAQVSVGKLKHLSIFGNDYDTVDGTGVRDYIHVVDLAIGHVKALEKQQNQNGGVLTVNLGTGKGSSVLQVVKAYEEASGVKIAYVFAPRREGDIAEYFADTTYAKEVLGWQAQYDLGQMCKDTYNFQKNNKNGYND